jgi:hypothetical protein
LTVSGSAKVNEGIFGIGTSGTILPLVNTAGTGTVVIGGTSPNTPALRLQGSPLNFFIGNTQVAQLFATTGNFTLQNGGTFTDSGARLHISGSTSQALLVASSSVGPALYVSGSGNVGIGTSAPNYGLEIANTGLYYSPGQLLITTSGSVNREGSFIASSTGRTLQLGISDNSVVPVGIDMFETNNTFGSTYLNFRVNNADLVRMTGSFVGIGTTTPSASLHITGSSNSALFEIDSPAVNNIIYVSGSGQVGIGTGTPLSSSILQIESTTRGFLIPRMTTTQRDAIASPATGLQIYNTTEGYVEYYDSFWGWMPLANQNEWKRKWGSEYFNDFGVNNAFTGDGVFQTFPVNGGTYNTSAQITGTFIGYMGLNTGTNTNGQNAIRTDLNFGRFWQLSHRISLVSRLFIPTLSDVTDRYNVLFGISTGTNSTVNTGCAFIYDEGGVGTGTTASPNWQIITAASSVRTNFVTSVPVAINTWYSFRIESNSTFTEIYYYINDTLVRTETTNIPTNVASSLPIISMTKTAGTTARTLAVDYLGYKMKLNSAR